MREPYTNDYNNLAKVMKYIQGNIGLQLILSIDKSGNINWYVDTEFAARKDMRRHIGGFMTMGTVVSYIQSSKQKMNTKRFNLGQAC